jgi:hypothetical protein
LIFKSKDRDHPVTTPEEAEESLGDIVSAPTGAVGPIEPEPEPEPDYGFDLPRQGEWTFTTTELPDGRVEWKLTEIDAGGDYSMGIYNSWEGISKNFEDARNSAIYKQDEAMRDRIEYRVTTSEKLDHWKPKEPEDAEV